MQAIIVRDRAAGVGGLSLAEMPYPHAAENDVARAGNRREASTQETAGATLGDRDREPESAAAVENNRREVSVAFSIDRPTYMLSKQMGSRLECRVGFRRGDASNRQTEIDPVGRREIC